jgi:hypothetical protein
MANKKISQLTAKGTALAATDLVEISEDAGGGNYLTKSVTGANIKSGLQDTLVSGTNIKTVNSTTLLGSGDLAVQPTLVSGTNIKTINSTTLLGSGDIVIGSGVHVLTKPVTGRSYSVRTSITSSSTTFSLAINNILLYPFIPANTLTISAIETWVTSPGVGAFLKLLVYSDVNGIPTSRLIESGQIVASTAGIKSHPVSFTFTAGTTYWLGTFIGTAPVNIYAIPTEQQTPVASNGFTGGYAQVVVSSTFPTAPPTLSGTALSAAVNIPIINLISA